MNGTDPSSHRESVEEIRDRLELVFRNSCGYVTKVQFLKFDLIKPISHLRASRRPKAL
jgi:hypothetical protein